MNDSFLDQMKSQAALYLGRAEAQFGLRDQSWTFIGVGFHKNGPHIWFPEWHERWVQIQLNSNCQQSLDQALYQLAHEVIHLLSPNKHTPANMLEEGLAVKFSIEEPQFSSEQYRKNATDYILTDPSASQYGNAYRLVERLLQLRPNAIQRLRSIQPNFYAMTTELIQQVLDVPHSLAESLALSQVMR